MRSFRIGLVLVGWSLAAGNADAGLNLGMKQACKRYGDAWNSGSQGALAGVTTGDFAAQWARVPPEVFARMPRGSGGRVLGSSKGGGVGHVTVSTSQGVLTFVLVGGGFHWTVADIYKPGDDGQTVSLKQYLDVTLTSGEFITRLKYADDDSFKESISTSFQAAFAALSETQLADLRSFLPEIHRNVKPYVRFDGDRATMKVAIPDREPGDTVTFHLRHDGGWRVDDYVIESQALGVPSFRNAMPMIAAVSGFRRFLKDPVANDPVRFTAAGSLRDALLAAQAQKPFPMRMGKDSRRIDIDESGRSAEIQFPNRLVRIQLEECEESPGIARITVKMGDRWADLSHLLALQSRLAGTLLARGIALPTAEPVSTPTAATTSVAAKVEPVERVASMLEPARAEEKESVSPLTNAAAQEESTSADAAPAIQVVAHQSDEASHWEEPARYRRRWFRRHR